MRQIRNCTIFLAACRAILLMRAVTAVPESATDRLQRIAFVKEMERIEQETLRRKSQKSLQERLLKVAKEMIPDPFASPKERELQNYNQNGDDNLSNYIYSYDNSVDLSAYAMKYVGCQNVHTWDDNLAGGQTSPLSMKRFVMFRMCKANDCSAYNKWGCNFNFGEYVIPMEDYLAIMAEYHFEQYGRFCKTCKRCMNLDYYHTDDSASYNTTTDDGYGDDTYGAYDDAYNINGANGYSGGCNLNDDGCTDDQYWAEYRKYWGERRQLAYNNNQGNGAKNYYYNNGGDDSYQYKNGNDDYFNNDVNSNPWYADQYGKCIFEETCSNYHNVCKKYDPDAAQYESFFTCTRIDIGGAYGYLGPHCRSDGRTIGIGIYNDQYCNEYVGDTSEISGSSGLAFDDSELQQYYDRDCISCSAEDGYSLITDDVLATGQDLTYPLCQLAYQVSGKCDRYMSTSVATDSYEFDNQEANEETICNFIESLVERNYDERGEVLLRSAYFNPEHWNNPGEYVKIVRAATPFQKVALALSMLLFFSFFGYAIYLTKKLVYRKPWRPPRSVISPYAAGFVADDQATVISEAGRLSRLNSGVVQIRAMASLDAGSVYNENASMANSQIV